MVSKEEALKNYISLLKFLISNYDDITDKVYSTPCLDYKDDSFFKEEDPFKIILQWNMFYRKNIYYFFKNSVSSDIDIINQFINKNNINIDKFKNDLNFLKNKCDSYFLLHKNIICIEEISLLNIKETVSETIEIFNDFKNIKHNTNQFRLSLDLKFKKKFYQFQIFENLANNIKYKHPNISFSIGVKSKISDFIFELVEE